MTEAVYTYCRTRWNHGLQTYPIEMWSELDSFRFEVRRLEIFPDGTMLWASPVASGGAHIGITPLDSMEEMATDPDCIGADEVTAEEFETMWARLPPYQRP